MHAAYLPTLPTTPLPSPPLRESLYRSDLPACLPAYFTPIVVLIEEKKSQISSLIVLRRPWESDTYDKKKASGLLVRLSAKTLSLFSPET